jgi:aspartate-semialdehyde dehydrogenase
MSIGFDRRVEVEDALAALHDWQPPPEIGCLPSAPKRALIVASERDRPQPRRDVGAGRGMSVTVGRVRADPVLDIRLVAMGHNTIRGAAGASVLNAELVVARGLMGP